MKKCLQCTTKCKAVLSFYLNKNSYGARLREAVGRAILLINFYLFVIDLHVY